MVFVEAKVIDSTHLELSRPIGSAQGRTVVVSIAEAGEADAERRQWHAVSAAALGAAYGQSEPDYSPSISPVYDSPSGSTVSRILRIS